MSHFKHIYSYFLFSKNTNTEHSTFLKILSLIKLFFFLFPKSARRQQMLLSWPGLLPGTESRWCRHSDVRAPKGSLRARTSHQVIRQPVLPPRGLERQCLSGSFAAYRNSQQQRRGGLDRTTCPLYVIPTLAKSMCLSPTCPLSKTERRKM